MISKYVTIDGLVIKYKEKYVACEQYMQDKLINHSLKMFLYWYPCTTVPLRVFVYVRKDNAEDSLRRTYHHSKPYT